MLVPSQGNLVSNRKRIQQLFPRDYLGKQGIRFGLGCAAGALLAAAVHVSTGSDLFSAQIYRAWESVASQARLTYQREITVLVIGLVSAVFIWAASWIRRYARSWSAGLTGLFFWATLLAAAGLLLERASSWPIALSLASLLALLGLEAWRKNVKRPLPSFEKLPLLVSGRSDIPAESRWTARSTDNPIEDFDSDILGRTAIVEMLAEHALQHRTPVLALNGDLGDGKTSVLNLLNKAIEPYAVVIPFSAWLPGSEATLAIELFRAIAAKCNEYVWIPHHRKRALAFARTLSGSVHGLSGFKELLPEHSQQDEIRELRDTFSRLNRPIVILIDEIDRMQKDELLVLLKILRGVSSIPNVSFICAFSDAVVRRQLDVENLASDYLEKFFPVSLNLSAPSPDLVGHCFRAEMVREFSNEDWFRTPTESNEFVKLMGEAWEDSLQPLCTNLRKAGLLINDSVSTGRAIVREVNPLDLVLIEAIRHFSPSIYSVIKANAPNLAGSNQNLYLVNKETTKQFFVELNTRIDNYEQSAAIKMLLYRLFPKYAATSQSIARIAFGSDQREGESSENSSKRICKPDYFWLYFRNALPEEMFSNADLDQFLAELSKSETDAEVETVFAKALGSMARGHAKRADFLRKLGRRSEELDTSTSESLAYAVAEHASDYQYDLFKPGESPQA